MKKRLKKKAMDKKNNETDILKYFNLIVILIIILIMLPYIYFNYIIPENNKKENVPDVYSENQLSLKQITGYTKESDWNLTKIQVTRTNITRINFTLEWVDFSYEVGSVGFDEIDEFDMTVSPPNNIQLKIIKSILRNKHNRTGLLYIDVLVNQIPPSDQEIDDGQSGTDLPFENTKGIGSWGVNITCVKATGYESSCWCPSAVKVEDLGNNWVLSTEIYYYYLLKN
jgi:hypothetical protein